ncbi:hypothetical protein [Deinococcus roseus]|uniref:hypothetical protein n=1 Tax=Deinococcus roseus TaxID=392414 RepID=UPI00166C0463|nr:hypothetical protein [Deinococcus roseus]
MNSKTLKSKVKMTALLIGLASVALAASGTYKLLVNGTTSKVPALIQNGQVYIPIEILKAVGIPYTVQNGVVAVGVQGGSTEKTLLEGCLNEWLFNGIWRIKVGNLQAIQKDENTPGWGLDIEVRNGSKMTLNMTDTGVDGAGLGMHLAFKDATTLGVDPYDVQKLTFKNLPQSATAKQQLKFYYPIWTPDSSVEKPVKLLLDIDPARLGYSVKQAGVAFSTPNPGFRVNLTCDK